MPNKQTFRMMAPDRAAVGMRTGKRRSSSTPISHMIDHVITPFAHHSSVTRLNGKASLWTCSRGGDWEPTANHFRERSEYQGLFRDNYAAERGDHQYLFRGQTILARPTIALRFRRSAPSGID
jgi:hypothetical protein